MNRPALLLHSPIVVALGIAMSMVSGKFILAQLPGVCTLPDGSSWSGPAEFERSASRPSEIAARLSSTDVASSPQASVINRYAPHSIPMTRGGSKSAIPIHNLSLRRLPQDDLLAPTGNNDATNLLEGSPPSFVEGDVLSQMGPDAQREKERAATKTGEAGKQAAVDPHWEVFANDKYPSAIKCSKCHQKIYDEFYFQQELQ